MNVVNTLKRIRKDKKLPLSHVAKILGKTQGALSDKVHRSGSMSVNALIEILDIYGCELVIRDLEHGCDYRLERDEE